MALITSSGDVPILDPSGPDGPGVTAQRIDFSETPLAAQYSPYFAMVIDNLLTPKECATILASAGSTWDSLNKGDSWRKCKQIISFSPEWAKVISERLALHLPDEVKALRKGDELSQHIAGAGNLKANQGASKTVWRFRGANDRLSFLRYGVGHHFKPHCDALYSPSDKEKSFLTCQVYLNDMPEDQSQEVGSSGGSTRFWPDRKGKGRKNPIAAHEGQEDEQEKREDTVFLDVRPKMGRALVFQQRMLWHSGEEVKHGEKFTVRLDLMYDHHFEKLTR